MNKNHRYEVTINTEIRVFLKLNDTQMLKLLKRLVGIATLPRQEDGNIIFYSRIATSTVEFIISNTLDWEPPTIATHIKEVKSPW